MSLEPVPALRLILALFISYKEPLRPHSAALDIYGDENVIRENKYIREISKSLKTGRKENQMMFY